MDSIELCISHLDKSFGYCSEYLYVLHIFNGPGDFVLEVLILQGVHPDTEVRNLRPPVPDHDVKELSTSDVTLGGYSVTNEMRVL